MTGVSCMSTVEYGTEMVDDSLLLYKQRLFARLKK